MKISIQTILTVVVFCISLTSVVFAQESSELPVVEGSLEAFLGEPEMDLHELFVDERFPNIVVSMEGTLIATWGSSSVRAVRSEDGGETWSNEIEIGPGIHGGGTTVDEATGNILAFVESGHPPAALTMYRSIDDGKSWQTELTEITADENGNIPSMHMNEHGITLRHGEHAGRLIRPSRYYGTKNDKSEWPNHYTNAIYSDDHGATWKTSSQFPENGTGEAAVIELSDGRLYYNSRVHWQERPRNTRRRCAISNDDGVTWEDWRVVEALPDGHQHRSYGCMGGLVRLPIAAKGEGKGRDILIFSNLDTDAAKRERATVWASFDGGMTWPVKRLVYDGPSAYSSLTAGRPGTKTEGSIYLHFEGGQANGTGSHMARFNLSWLLEGEETGDGVIPDLAE